MLARAAPPACNDCFLLLSAACCWLPHKPLSSTAVAAGQPQQVLCCEKCCDSWSADPDGAAALLCGGHAQEWTIELNITGGSRLTVQSVLHDTQVSPSGAKAMPFTAPVCPSSRLRARLAGMSQMRMPPSAVPDSRLFSSLGFRARHVMPSECVRLAIKGLANMRSSLAALRARVYS